ncbi:MULTISPECIES: hypothetical protein [Fredinandcohnia]|jgi:hypothetical protein|uniref:Uncharacterized protein n=1 Tax=Fredinandcohnia salidurans TaxID=2595041 RepID=A0ABW4MM47_9BACI|nr:hypothetical protein [Fredinandcohnia onubensis]
MASYIMDLGLIAILVIGITALMGVIANGVGEKVFGGKSGSDIVTRDLNVKAGWKNVGGRKK